MNEKDTILVIEDYSNAKMLFRLMLEELGYHVMTESNGEDGLLKYGECKDSIDLILTDVDCGLNTGIDGPRMVRAIRADNPTLPIVFMSGDLGEYDEDELMSMSGQPVLWKPFGAKALSKAIEAALHRKTATA